MYRSLSKYIVIPNGGHEIVSTINVGFQSLFSFHRTIELPFSYCNFHVYSFNGKLKKKSKILHLKRENMLFCWAKIWSLRAGFEPARGDPIGFQVQRLNHSAITAFNKGSFFFLISLDMETGVIFPQLCNVLCTMIYLKWDEIF